MATLRNILKHYFRRFAIPTEVQFAELIDSFWHKTEDLIPQSCVENLAETFANYLTANQIETLLSAINNDIELLQASDIAQDTTISNNSSDITALQSSYNQASVLITALQTALVALQNDTNALASRVGQNENDIITLQGSSASTQQSITNINTTLSSVSATANNAETVATRAEGKADANTTAITNLDNELNDKVDKILGKGLSTEDYTTEEKSIVANAANCVVKCSNLTEIENLANETIFQYQGADDPTIDIIDNDNLSSTIRQGYFYKKVNNPDVTIIEAGTKYIDIENGQNQILEGRYYKNENADIQYSGELYIMINSNPITDINNNTYRVSAPFSLLQVGDKILKNNTTVLTISNINLSTITLDDGTSLTLSGSYGGASPDITQCTYDNYAGDIIYNSSLISDIVGNDIRQYGSNNQLFSCFPSFSKGTTDEDVVIGQEYSIVRVNTQPKPQLTAGTALIADANGNPASSVTSANELAYLVGMVGNKTIQQLFNETFFNTRIQHIQRYVTTVSTDFEYHGTKLDLPDKTCLIIGRASWNQTSPQGVLLATSDTNITRSTTLCKNTNTETQTCICFGLSSDNTVYLLSKYGIAGNEYETLISIQLEI